MPQVTLNNTLIALLALSLPLACEPGGVGVLPGADDVAAPMTRADFPKPGQYERYKSLLDENGRITPDGLMKAKAMRDELLMQPLAGGGVSPGTWKWHGPSNIAGRMRALYIHPILHDVMVLGSASGGIWRTEDGGQTWKVVDDWLPSLAVSSIVAHPSAPGTLYAGTGETFAGDGIPGAGIFKSEDLGKTWTRLPSTATTDFRYVNELAISPTNARLILAATDRGVFRSTNAGQSWTQTRTGEVLDVHFSPDGISAIAFARFRSGIYSLDAGVTWSSSSVLPTGASRIEFSFAGDDPRLVYAGVARSGFGGLWVSRDRGKTFSAVGARTNPYGSAGYYLNAIWVDPASDGERFLLGGVPLQVSSNAGRTWSGVVGPHPDIHVLVAHPKYDGDKNQTVFVGTDGGLYRIDNLLKSTRKTESLNKGLGTAQFYGGAVTADGLVIGGMQDNGSQMLRTTRGTDWTFLQPFDGIHCEADPVDRRVYYGTSQYSGVFRILDGGTSPDRFDPPNAVAGKSPFRTKIQLDPNRSSRLYCGTRDLMVCYNTKTSATPTWRKLTSIDTDWQFVTAMAVTPGNSDVVYHSHNSSDLYKSTNATQASPTWTQITDPRLNRFITEIVVSPHDPEVVYVCQGGYMSGNLRRSQNGGRTWQTIVGGRGSRLPAAPIQAFAIHPIAPDWLYVGTEIGLFVSQDGGASWSASNEGPSNAVIDHLVFRGDRLWAFTHGRGVYSAHASTPADADSVVRASVSSFELEANADSQAASIDAQGRRVAFHSEASNLVLGDTNRQRDIFVRDLQAGTTVVVNEVLGSARANGSSANPCIAHEGRFVAFESEASNLVAGDTNGQRDIFVRDLQDCRTERIPPRTGATQPGGSSRSASITPAGRYVVFTSEAPNLVIGDTNKVADVFHYDRARDVMTRVSVAGQNGQANAASKNSMRAVSANGDLVAFESAATRLVSEDTNGRSDIFVRDLVNRTTTRVSVSSSGAQANGESRDASVDAEGRYVVFGSFADNLVPGDRNDTWDVFLHDRVTKKTERVSVTASGGEANGPSFGGIISPDGGFVTFYSSATNLVGGDSNKRIDVFVRDLTRRTTTRVSIDAAGAQANGASAAADIAAQAANIAFQSIASNLVPQDRNGAEDVFTTAPRPGFVVWPASRAVRDGIGFASKHFAGPSRSQHVYRAGFRAQLRIGALRLRRDASQEGGQAYARRVVVEVLAGPADIDALSGEFSKNFTKAPTRVFSRKPLSLPDLRAVPQSLPGFRLRIPLDRAYVHDGQSDLAIDLIVDSSTEQGEYPLDMHGELTSVRATTTVLGTGCKTSKGNFAFDMSYVSTGRNSQLGVSAEGALPQSPIYLMLGAVDPDLSLPGLCAKLRTVSLINLFVGVTDADGKLGSEFQVSPWSPSLAGAKMTSQLLTLDLQQKIPLSLSNGRLIRFPAGRPGPSARSVFAPGRAVSKGKLQDLALTLALEQG